MASPARSSARAPNEGASQGEMGPFLQKVIPPMAGGSPAKSAARMNVPLICATTGIPPAREITAVPSFASNVPVPRRRSGVMVTIGSSSIRPLLLRSW